MFKIQRNFNKRQLTQNIRKSEINEGKEEERTLVRAEVINLKQGIVTQK